MGYRDEGEAALLRLQSLEGRVAELEVENRELQSRLEEANASIVRLRGTPIPTPGLGKPISSTNRTLLLILAGVALVGLLPFAMAAYRSESKGVEAALFVFPLWGALIGAYRGRRSTTPRLFLGGLIGAVATFGLLVLFFATLWRSL